MGTLAIIKIICGMSELVGIISLMYQAAKLIIKTSRKITGNEPKMDLSLEPFKADIFRLKKFERMWFVSMVGVPLGLFIALIFEHDFTTFTDVFLLILSIVLPLTCLTFMYFSKMIFVVVARNEEIDAGIIYILQRMNGIPEDKRITFP